MKGVHRRDFLIAAGGLLAAPLAAEAQWTSKSFQDGADVVRLKHLKYYSDLLAEYHAKKGKYPLQESATEMPVYVFVAHDDQSPRGKPAYKHLVVPMRGWVQDLEAGLERSVDEHYDPQLYGDGYKPNFYIYMMYRGTYFLAVHLYQDYPFANHVSEHYNKLEVSNRPNPKSQAADPETLFRSEAFLNALSVSYKVEFFQEREAKYLHFTKQQN
jgi:hypothetical protein